ncbi:MAG: hypothetical protein ABRQ38_20620 [Candidatus Eremiobacterota bacterium]
MVDFNSQPSTLNFKQLARRALSSPLAVYYERQDLCGIERICLKKLKIFSLYRYIYLHDG